jgi:hypothetical protein
MRQLLPVALLVALLAAVTPAAAQMSSTQIYPHPKSAFPRGAAFALDASTRIVTADAQSPAAARAAEWLRDALARATGLDLSIIPESRYAGGPAIVLATLGASASIDARARAAMPPGEPMPPAGGYVVDASAEGVTIVGADDDGMFNAVATVRQLATASGTIRAMHVWDYPDYPVRWVFNQQNLRGAGAIGALRTILDTMSVLKLNAIQQNDFKYSILQMQPAWYFDSVRAYRDLSEQRGIGVVPGVASIGYSEGILWNDPNLAEGFPATSRYIIESDTARLVPDTRVAIPNGGFESVDGNGRFTGWSYYDESTVSVDHSIVHGGATSARCSNFNGANSRFIRNVQCRPNSAYVMTAWLRTDQLKGGELRLLAIGTNGPGSSRTLAYTMYGLSGTSNGWRKVQVVFNTLEYSQMNLYVGLWGGGSGTFWVDDFEIREHGLANVLRRKGAPLHVRSTDGRTEYREGLDFAPVVDPLLASGVYPWHEPPTFRRASGGALRNGDTIDISFFHPVTTYGDEDGIGQVMVCLSEETLLPIIHDQIARVDTLYDASHYFIHHDEIRVMNRDSACLERGMTPAELLADNVADCVAIIDSVHPGAKVFAWSDMFDSLHNAVDDYFLVNGDLRGVWNMIPKGITIANWNNGSMRASLDFFSRLGFEQVAAPYYDQRDTRNIRAWRLALEETPGARGMIYTTWVGDFSYLRPYAYYAWGAGPNIVHTPLDTSVLLRPTLDSVMIEALVTHDPYDASDRITSVIARVDVAGAIETVTLREASANRWVGYAGSIARDGFRYGITATNAQGLERATPEYIVARAVSSGIDAEAAIAMSLSARPNPMRASGAVSFVAPSSGSWTMQLVDALGRIVATSNGTARERERVSISIDAASIPQGAYRCQVRIGRARSQTSIIVQP